MISLKTNKNEIKAILKLGSLERFCSHRDNQKYVSYDRLFDVV